MAFLKKAITGRSGPTPNLVSWTPLEGRLPMKHVVTGHRLGGAVALAVGSPWLFHAAKFLMEELERTGFAFGQAFLFLLVIGGLLVTLFGLSQFIYREETVIDSETVRRTRRGLSGFKRWQETLPRYRGVLKEYQYWSSQDRPGMSYMEYTLSLHHDEPSKRVLLYESRNSMTCPPDEWSRLWAHYANLFRLPVLEGGRDGVAASTVEDLTRPILDKIAEGKVHVPKIDLNRPRLPSGLSLNREDDLWVVTLKPVGYVGKTAFLLAMAAGAVGVGMVFYIFPRSIPPFLLMLAFAGALLAGAIYFVVPVTRKFRHPDQVAVDAGTVWYRTWDRGRWDARSIPVAEIVNITLRAEPAYYSPGEQVVVESKRSTLAFGAALTDRARRQLKDILLFLVSLTVPTKTGGVR